LFLREADPAAAESAIIDYGNALRDLAASNVFPGDLLLKNFGVTSHGRVIFYDYDELCLVSDCVFRDLPAGRAARKRKPARSPGSTSDRTTCSRSNGCSFWHSAAARGVFAPSRRAADRGVVAPRGRVRFRDHGCLAEALLDAIRHVPGRLHALAVVAAVHLFTGSVAALLERCACARRC
jgi:hypothetical protein